MGSGVSTLLGAAHEGANVYWQGQSGGARPHAPGVCSPEPGGMHSTDLRCAVEATGESGAVSMVEIVEPAPVWDTTALGAGMACYALFDLLGANARDLAGASHA